MKGKKEMKKLELCKKLLEVLNDVEFLVDENEGINFISNDYENSFNDEKIKIVDRVCNCLNLDIKKVIGS